MFELDQLFQKSDLIPVIVQHEDTREVLMLGFTNREAVELTLQTRTAWFWSPEPPTIVEQRGVLRAFSPCEAHLDRLRYRYPALPMSAGWAYLPYRRAQLLFPGN